MTEEKGKLFLTVQSQPIKVEGVTEIKKPSLKKKRKKETIIVVD